jgi:hypothetical protein
MSHFAKVNEFDLVENVIVAEQDFIDSLPDKEKWIQTSYNTHGNVHYGQDGKPDGGVALRGNYACINCKYDRVNDVFLTPQPFLSWSLDSNWTWQPPTPMPIDGKEYIWNEGSKSWKEF